MFTAGGAILIDSGGLQIPATVLAKDVIAGHSPAGTITLNRGVNASLRRSATRVLEGTSCGRSSSTIAAGTTTLIRESLSGKKKDFPHTPDPGDTLLIVDAAGAEMATVAQASGNVITLTQPTVRAFRPAGHAFDQNPTVRFFYVAPNDPATHQTTLRPVRLRELTGVYAGGHTILTLDKTVDRFTIGSAVALGDGARSSAHTVLQVENVDARTRLTLSGAAPTALRVAFLNVYGAFAHSMHVAGYDHSESTLAAGASQLEIVGTPRGLTAGLDLVVADTTHAEGARIVQVLPLADRTLVSLSQPLEFAFALGDTTVYGNVARVTHGASAPEEVLGGGNPAAAPQRFDLSRSPLALVADAASPRGVAPAVEVFVGGERWTRVETLADSGPIDRHYVIEIDDREHATVVFGDGANGAAPPSGRNNITARYRAGHGAQGNVAALGITRMPQPAAFLDRTFNPAAASGGADREAPDSARRQARLRVRLLDRAVSLADYAGHALAFAGIGKARATMEREGRGAGARRVIVVTCAAAGGNPLSAPQKDALLAYLSSRSAEPERIRIRDYRPWPVRLVLTVHVLPDFQQAAVQRDVLAAFGRGAGGFFAFDRRDLGGELTLSDVYAIAEATPGVDHVLATAFHAETATPQTADRIQIPDDAVATGGDAADAAVGRLSLQLLGGLS
jgi:uncharacterized phage protein gp47/JayE